MSKFGEISLPSHVDLLGLLHRYLPQPQGQGEHVLQGRALACAMNERAYDLTVQRMGQAAQVGDDISGLMAIMKLVHTEQERDKFEVLLDLMGGYALGWQSEASSDPQLAITRGWLNSYALTISGGASEVQLNVIAKRVLGLPEAKKGVTA
jgi:alkylation response protein AidB-like acyl-CoA dehydrogenase